MDLTKLGALVTRSRTALDGEDDFHVLCVCVKRQVNELAHTLAAASLSYASLNGWWCRGGC